jgi:hypothetical protein
MFVSFQNFFKDSSNIILAESSDGVIKHLTHLEELILTSKQQGLNLALGFLNQLLDLFKGNADTKTFVSVKIDGAPACIVGINPENQQFFVATKSVANANPKINYNDLDVDKNHGHAPGLAKKLKLALKYLPAVIRQGIYQGDFLFDQQDLLTRFLDGEQYVTFKPNTITYAVPLNTPLGQRIIHSKIGIVFHTRYFGQSLQLLTKSSDVNVTEFNRTSDAFVDDAKFKDVSGTVSFTNKETKQIERLLKKAQTQGNKIKWDEIPQIAYDQLNTFINSLIREGRFISDPVQEYEMFISWIQDKNQKTLGSLKTEKGRQKRQEQLDDINRQINNSKLSIINVLSLTIILEQSKKMFIEKYNAAIRTKQFITLPDGTLKVTNPEGYVAVDNDGNMIKLVDRLEFSRANFSISKGDKFK